MRNKRYYYKTALVCLGGHIVTAHYDKIKHGQVSTCDKCHAPCIHECQHCHAPIPGCYHVEYDQVTSYGELEGHIHTAHRDECVRKGSYQLPLYCPKCNAPYPWTAAHLKVIDEWLAKARFMTDEEREDFRKRLPDIMMKNPRTLVSAHTIAEYLNRLPQPISEGLRDTLSQLATGDAAHVIGVPLS